MDLKERKRWNENHKLLTKMLVKPEQHFEAIQLFLTQHALLHSSAIENSIQETLVDAMVKNLDEETYRTYPVSHPDTENSIVWHTWHIARIEDMTMNILVANDQQILFTESWLEKMNIEYLHSGNDMIIEDIATLSSTIDFDSLLAYREAVGRQTRKIISTMEVGQFKKKVDHSRIRRLFEENAILLESQWLADYWSKKTIAGLLLMPATRHNFLHLNKCIRIKEKLQKLNLKMKK
ncbi:DinB family protein [Cytobacillus sp.]|uniref:DinB family protein n=1 Tax=Cytobacillus sp. TaxID=2675269 RepID=UPI0028BD41CB|nr:DinB family protein [Cytobacillus sp.]